MARPALVNPDGTPLRGIAQAAAPFPDPSVVNGITFAQGQSEIGSSGLRQFRGWIREEFLQQLTGRQGARVFREMSDNDSAIGAIIFTIKQVLRSVEWSVNPKDDTGESTKYSDYAHSLMDDMTATWGQTMDEALSMLVYGYAPMEVVYKRRMGRNDDDPTVNSRYDDGFVGLRKIALRGQETILRWYLDATGSYQGFQQMPWVGPLIDVPAEKTLLFRPTVHKQNPEGRSVLRNAYRSWMFVKRLQEQECIVFERMGGIPVFRLPKAVFDAASGATPDPVAVAIIASAKRMATNIRIDEQMGLVLPSDLDEVTKGKLYDFELIAPQLSRAGVNAHEAIQRYQLDMMTTVLSDFIALGHQLKGAYNLAINKVDMFYKAIEGWIAEIADVLNRYLLPRLWKLNGFDPDLMPEFTSTMAERIDLDVLSNFILRLGQVGIIQPDPALENVLRDAANLPPRPEGMVDTNDMGAEKPAVTEPADSLAKKVRAALLRPDPTGL